MNKIIILFAVLCLSVGCTKVEPIDIIEPQRDIDTKLLKEYKSNLGDRDVVIGMIYDWGKLNQSNLMNTPDSLDVIVVKDGYLDISENQKKDLKDVQDKKATKVLLGVNFREKISVYEENLEREIKEKKSDKEEELRVSGEVLTEDEKKEILAEIEENTKRKAISNVEKEMESFSKNILKLAKQNSFDGISVEFPESYNDAYSMDKVQSFLEDISKEAGKDKSMLLILENPSSVKEELINQANWVVFRQRSSSQLLYAIQSASNEFKTSHFVPASDFSIEGLEEGFKDSERYPIPNQLYEIIYWKSDNKAGVAYYHIEMNYNDMVGKESYKSLRTAINKTQLK